MRISMFICAIIISDASGSNWADKNPAGAVFFVFLFAIWDVFEFFDKLLSPK